LACELVGGLPCGLSDFAAGEMGQLKRDRTTGNHECVVGNLLQFHPDNPRWIVHCNCKPQASWQYTHVALPIRFPELLANLTRSREPGKNAYQLVPRATVTAQPSFVTPNATTRLQVIFEPQRGRPSRAGPPSMLFCDKSAMEPIEAALSRQPVWRAVRGDPLEEGGQLTEFALCHQFGLRCKPPKIKQSNITITVEVVALVMIVALLAALVTCCRFCQQRNANGLPRNPSLASLVASHSQHSSSATALGYTSDNPATALGYASDCSEAMLETSPMRAISPSSPRVARGPSPIYTAASSVRLWCTAAVGAAEWGTGSTNKTKAAPSKSRSASYDYWHHKLPRK